MTYAEQNQIRAPAEQDGMETTSAYLQQLVYTCNVNHRPLQVGFSEMLCVGLIPSRPAQGAV